MCPRAGPCLLPALALSRKAPCIEQEKDLDFCSRYMKTLRGRRFLLLVSLLLSLAIIGMIPTSRVHHSRTVCTPSHVGVAATRRFTCDVSSACDLVVNAETNDARLLEYVVIADSCNFRPLRAFRIAPPPLRRLTKRVKLAPSRTDSEDPLV